MKREDVESEFVRVLNIIEPEHPYFENPYPLSENEIKFGYKKEASPYYASCGPRNGPVKKVNFKFDISYFQTSTMARRTAIFLHELTHISVGLHTDAECGSHPPRFWRELGFNTHIAIDNLSMLNRIVGDFTAIELVGEIISEEVTGFNVDRRYGKPIERKHEMARWFNSTLR
jgi:hypothetical protein